MSNPKPYLFVLIAILAPSVVFGATASELARRAEAADVHADYRGMKTARVTVGSKTVLSVMKITHMKPGMTRTQYYSPSSLAGVIVVQNGPNAWRYDPRQKSWEQVRSAASMPADLNIEGAFKNYGIRMIGSEKIAGRDAYVILVTPKRSGQACHRIWVDKASYLRLKTQVERPSGAVISSSRFTAIDVNPKDISPSAFAVKGKVSRTPRIASVDFRVERPRYLPKGYKLVGLTRARVSGHLCAHLQISNGVDTISLFERRSDANIGAPRVPGRLKTVMTWTRDQLLLTLVGDLSRAELKKIADSTR